MSRITEYEEYEYRIYKCDYSPCGKEKRHGGYDLPRGWVSRAYIAKDGYRFKYSDEITHYSYDGDFCCKSHADKWLAACEADDKGTIDVYEWRGTTATAL